MTGPTDRFPHSDPRTVRLATASPPDAALPGATTPLHRPGEARAQSGSRGEGPTEPFDRPTAEAFGKPAAQPGDYPTEPLGQPHTADDEPPRSGFWRELSGALAVGLCVLAAAVIGLQAVAWSKGMPGPGVLVVLGHVAAGVAAVVVQRQVDRRRGAKAALPALAVAAIVAAVIWFFWWS